MPRPDSFVPRGVIPAVILPFTPDLEIDEAAFRAHLLDVGATPGLSAVTVNAHSTEAASCTFAEQRRVMALTMETIGDRLPVVHGIYAEGSIEAARIARAAVADGASALLVFPPGPFTLGHRPAMVKAHYQRIADAAGDVPLIAFNYPLAINQGYTTEMIVELAEAVPTVLAIKDWCNVPTQHERNIRVLQSLPRPVNVLSTHSAWLFPSLVLGCAGLLSGSGSVIAGLQARLFAAVQTDDLAAARQINDLIHPLADVFYAAPAVDMHNRMKEALVLMGKLECAAVRPPLVKIADGEIARIRRALEMAGLMSQPSSRTAAE
ncbi:MAG: dihydrodipicolinate synthase family protein [Hyphomicrobiaceae bacterium]